MRLNTLDWIVFPTVPDIAQALPHADPRLLGLMVAGLLAEYVSTLSTLRKFYAPARPAGPGWKPIRAEVPGATSPDNLQAAGALARMMPRLWRA